MEFLSLLAVLVVLAILVLPIVAIVIANSRARELRAEMAAINARIWNLEARLRQFGAQPAPALGHTEAHPQQAPLAVDRPVHPSPPAESRMQAGPDATTPLGARPRAPIAPPAFLTQYPAETGNSSSLESRIGSQWFNRIGILAVLIGVAWFLKLAFDNHWIGPLGRVLIGLLAGAALIGWSERFQKHGFPAFSYSLKAVGSGILYLSLWAAFQVYALVPAGVAFAAMIAVTAFNAVLAWSQESELLALYAIAGGLGTPALVSTGGNHEITLFVYLLILDLAVLILVAVRPWSRLLFGAFAGTVVFVCAWWFTFFTQAQAARTAAFFLCFFLLFALAPRLIEARSEAGEALYGWDALAQVLLPVANAALGFAGFYGLLGPATVDWAAPWIAVAFAAFYLLPMRIPDRGIFRAGPPLLSSLHLSIAIVFLTIAIPLKTHTRWMTIAWLVEGAVLLWVARQARSLLIRTFALICLALGLGALLLVNPPAVTRPILNERFATYFVAIAVFVFVAWVAKNSKEEDGSAQAPIQPLDWPTLAIIGVLLVNILFLVAFSLEIHSFWWRLRWRGNFNLLHDYRMYAQFTYSAFFMLYGAVLLAAGFVRQSAFLRWQALVLLAATIAKVFLVDISELSRGFRIFSFIGLGILLLCVSFAYQRDWLNLRGTKEESK